MNRDHWVWWLGMVGAVLTALANQAGVFPPDWKPYIDIATVVIAAVSGKLATSPLPGENDSTKASAGSAVKMLLPFVLAGSLAASACGPPKEYKTEPEKQLWYASQVLSVIHDVQAVAISVNTTNPEILPTETTRLIVNFSESSAKAIRSAPDGWAKQALDAWLLVKPKLPEALVNNVAFAVPMAKLESLLRTFAGVTP
jgi:hypothetical protein